MTTLPEDYFQGRITLQRAPESFNLINIMTDGVIARE
jgi:hypothetical protein